MRLRQESENMRTLIATCIAVMVSFGITAQDSTRTSSNVGYIFSASIGCFCGIQNQDVNATLQSNAFPPLSGNMYSLHFAFGFIVEKFSMLYNLKAYGGGAQTNTDYNSFGGGFAFELRFQYDLIKTEGFYAGPYAGFGILNMYTQFDSKTPASISTALQAVTVPIDSRTLTTLESFGTVGAAFGLQRKRSEFRKYRYGVSAGYQFANKGDWRLNGELLQQPSSSFSGMELRLDLTLIYSARRKGK